MTFGNSAEQFLDHLVDRERKRCSKIVEACAMEGRSLYDALAAIQDGGEPVGRDALALAAATTTTEPRTFSVEESLALIEKNKRARNETRPPRRRGFAATIGGRDTGDVVADLIDKRYGKVPA